ATGNLGQGGYMPYGDRPYQTGSQRQYNPNYNPWGSYSYTPPPPPPPQKPKKKGLKTFFALLAVVVAISLLASSFSLGRLTAKTYKHNSQTNEETTNSGPSLNVHETPTDGMKPSENGKLSTVEVAEKVKPSVIGITVYTRQSSGGFQTNQAAGEGSGVVMGTDEKSEYTYIVTCAHVINDNNANIVVQLEDGTQKDAELVGYDMRTDIGVIKVKMKGLKAAEFGDSKALRVGEQVFAVGNPGGSEFFGSFTSGVVSAIDRPVNSSIGYTMELIQHDAAINPGNSGGALVNSYGQVVGINSQKIIASEYEGMGFAIPISAAKSIVDSLIKFGYVPNRPKLGITYYSANSNQTYSMVVALKDLPAGTLYINEISPDSDLANTEARRGDLITAVNGKNLDTANVLLKLIDEGKVGDVLELTLCRIGRNYQVTEFKVKVKLVEDKGSKPSAQQGETTTDPFEYFFNPFGN
ncbi:MAG TPA: trypsin-like peptidase domain-containing protein, partial [Clostridiales bacterium]|nr:trypsin-like peptidase domain-containing protein [Clostridiales bacterium]